MGGVYVAALVVKLVWVPGAPRGHCGPAAPLILCLRGSQTEQKCKCHERDMFARFSRCCVASVYSGAEHIVGAQLRFSLVFEWSNE